MASPSPDSQAAKVQEASPESGSVNGYLEVADTVIIRGKSCRAGERSSRGTDAAADAPTAPPPVGPARGSPPVPAASSPGTGRPAWTYSTFFHPKGSLEGLWGECGSLVRVHVSLQNRVPSCSFKDLRQNRTAGAL